ncbi:indole-3-glycerol phosphate synthase TrpC [Bacillus sp. FJAT-52991]|uniref:Indole-3-glycerol phosphate synthase n=1 Tax=Bacillus kandeliae TaxID=3129297 RepID=A0ABZ2NAW7_9BACI
MTITILDRILAKKKEEVEQLKGNVQKEVQLPNRIRKSLYESCMQSKTMNLIAEIKRASPSKGAINLTVDPQHQAQIYENSGADAISVLTDESFFKGTMADLKDVRTKVDVPILCKDFIIDPIQIDRAEQAGANVILLIAAALHQQQLQELYEYAKERELDVLLEVHNEEEMERALAINATIIGINNRDLNTFQVDLATTERLLQVYDQPDIVFVSESGIQTKEDVKRVRSAGARAILVGETLMKSSDIPRTIEELKIRL